MKAFKIMYMNGKYEIPAYQTSGIPDKGIAEKIMAKRAQSPILRDKQLYLKEVEIEREPLLPNRELDGKVVINEDHYYVDALEVGDYVESSIVDNVLDCLPPACMRSNCVQLGEPMTSRIDEEGRDRSVYLTFSQVNRDTWKYCGVCFRGENVERGTIPPYLM